MEEGQALSSAPSSIPPSLGWRRGGEPDHMLSMPLQASAGCHVTASLAYPGRHHGWVLSNIGFFLMAVRGSSSEDPSGANLTAQVTIVEELLCLDFKPSHPP